MDKYQKALDRLKAKYTFTSNNGKVLLGIIDLTKTHKEEFITLQELVDKEKGLKVEKYQEEFDSIYEDSIYYPICPKCGQSLWSNTKYCYYCGQKLIYEGDKYVQEEEKVSVD